MSTTSYSPNEGNVPSAAIPLNQGPPRVRSRTRNVPGSPLLSRSRFHDDNCEHDHSEISDDDLVTAAQCGDQQAFVELCGRHSTLTKRKIFSIVRNHQAGAAYAAKTWSSCCRSIGLAR